MTWTDTYVFVDPIVDLRSEVDRPAALEAELTREIALGLPRTVSTALKEFERLAEFRY